MNTLIDLDDTQTAALDRLSRGTNQSPAELIKAAIDAYIKLERDRAVDSAYGSWGDRKVDGLEYQERLRAEW